MGTQPTYVHRFRVALGIAAFVLLAVGVFLAINDALTAAGLVFGAAIICLIFVFLTHFKSFKAFGVEAELQEKVAEADELLARLRGTMVPIAEMLFSTAARMGRWSTAMSREQKLSLMQRIEAELQKCGVTAAQLERAKSDWHFYNVFDLSTPVDQKISKALQAKLKERQSEVAAVPQPVQSEMHGRFSELVARSRAVSTAIEELQALHQEANDPALGKRLRNFVSNSSLFDDSEKAELLESIRDELDDVQHYIDHKEFRRLAVWLAGK